MNNRASHRRMFKWSSISILLVWAFFLVNPIVHGYSMTNAMPMHTHTQEQSLVQTMNMSDCALLCFIQYNQQMHQVFDSFVLVNPISTFFFTLLFIFSATIFWLLYTQTGTSPPRHFFYYTFQRRRNFYTMPFMNEQHKGFLLAPRSALA